MNKFMVIDAQQSNLRTINTVCETINNLVRLEGKIEPSQYYGLAYSLMITLNQANYTNKLLNQYLTPDKGLNTDQRNNTEIAINKALNAMKYAVGK